MWYINTSMVPADPSDQSLIQRAQRRDPDAITELYRRYAGQIYRYFWFRVADEAVAQDLTGEVFLNPTNLQWITALGLILTLLKRDPETAAEWGMDGGLLVLAGLTGPFSVLLAPLFVVRALMRRTRASWLIAGVVALTAGIQGWFICHAPAFPNPGAWHWANLIGVLSVRLPMTLALGEQWPVKLGCAWTAPLGAALMGGLIFLSCRWGRWRGARLLLLAALALWLLAAIKRARPDTWVFYDTFNGDRYFYGPKVLGMWLVALVIADLRNRWCQSLGVVLASLAFSTKHLSAKAQAMLPWLGLFRGGVFEDNLLDVSEANPCNRGPSSSKEQI